MKKSSVKNNGASFIKPTIIKIILTIIFSFLDYKMINYVFKYCTPIFEDQIVPKICSPLGYLNLLNIPLGFSFITAFGAPGVSAYLFLVFGVLVQVFVFYLISCALVWLFNKFLRN